MTALTEATPNDGYVAFRYRDFRLHCSARFLYGIALSMQTVAIGWYIYSVTKSPLALGFSGLASFLPPAFLALFTGHLADTLNRRLIISVAFTVSATVSLLLAGLALQGTRNIDLIYACILINSCARAFANPAAQSLTPSLVPRQHFANAITWYSSAWSSSRIVGPALGGLLYIFGSSVAFFVASVLFAISAFCVFLIATNSKPQEGRGAITWATVSAGLQFIWSHKVILGGISLDLVAVLFGGATALLPVVTQDILHTGPWGLGLLRSAPAIGAVSMGAFLAHYPITGRAGRKMLVAVGCYGLATMLFGLSHHLVLSMAMLALVGASDQVSVVVRHTIVQSETPENMRGRVSAVNSIFISGSSDLGDFESGATAALWGTVPAIIFGGFATSALAGAWWFLFPKLRNRDKLVET